MAKINRRDYLLQMGAAGAFVGASKLISPTIASAQSNQSKSGTRASITKARFLFGPKTTTPPTANLTALFIGLMGFSNTNDGVAQVGFQKGNGKHKLEIKVFMKIGSECYKLRSIGSDELADVKKLELGLSGQTPNVDFFHREDFDRTITDDLSRKDFGWVLDFEDDLLYPDGVTMTKKFSPILALSNGTFYTHHLSNSKFNLIDVNGNVVKSVINQLPRAVGAAINIQSGMKAVLKLDSEVVIELPYLPGVQYQVQFLNECYDGADHCMWHDPKDPDEKKRNDFYMHHFMFKPKNSSAKKYGVIVETLAPGSHIDRCPRELVESSDESPCMGTGFGGKTGFS